jgi:hypothetical protein
MKLEPVVVTLKPGQALRVELFETDGAFEIHYDTPDHKGCLVVKEAEGLPDSYERVGILYCEEFGREVAEDCAAELALNETDAEGGPADDLYEAAEQPFTYAIYSSSRKKWFSKEGPRWLDTRDVTCEFLQSHYAQSQCRVILHNYGMSEQMVVLRSDQKP